MRWMWRGRNTPFLSLPDFPLILVEQVAEKVSPKSAAYTNLVRQCIPYPHRRTNI